MSADCLPPGKPGAAAKKRPCGRPRKKKLRPKRLKLTPSEQKGALIALKSSGMSAADIAASIGCSVRTVRRGGFKDREPDPKKDKVTAAVKKRRVKLVKLLKKNPRATSQELADLLPDDDSPSKRTVARDLRAEGVRHLTCETVQRLTDKQKEKRLAFCKKYLKIASSDTFWRKIVFSDETKRGTSDMDRTCWVPPGGERLQTEHVKWDCKIHVWGYIGTDGCRHIQLCPGHTVTAENYLDLLKKTVGKRKWKKTRVFQQDNAPAHSAKVVKNWLQKNVEFIDDWPPNSPDLSPIENVWGRMWPDAMKKRPKTEADLWRAVEEVFDGYPEIYFENLVMSFRKRLVLCLEREGASISELY